MFVYEDYKNAFEWGKCQVLFYQAKGKNPSSCVST